MNFVNRLFCNLEKVFRVLFVLLIALAVIAGFLMSAVVLIGKFYIVGGILTLLLGGILFAIAVTLTGEYI